MLASEHGYFVDHTMTNIFLVLWLRVVIPVALEQLLWLSVIILVVLKQLAEWLDELDERRASNGL